MTGRRPTLSDRTVHHQVYFEPWADPRIRDGLNLSRPILVFGRQSGEVVSGNAGSVVSDLTEALDALHTHLGIDARHLLPERDFLTRSLRNSKDVSESNELDSPDKTFKHTYYTVDPRSTGAAVVLILALGSSHKADVTRNNPFIVRMADEVAEKTPILLFTKNTSRQFRQGWGQAPLRLEIDRQARQGRTVYQGTEKGLRDGSLFAAANDLLEGEKNKAEAESIYKNTRRRILTRTGHNPVFDPAGTPWHHSSPPPPGLLTLRLARTPTRPADRYLCLDSPSTLPTQRDTLDRLPQPLDAQGNPADQVAAVRWYLAHAGRDDITADGLFTEMMRRGFTTEGLRNMQRNPDVTFATAEQNNFEPQRNAIVNNLHTYETGTLTRSVTPDTITLTGLFPPDGPWAQPEDFDRIRKWLALLGQSRRAKVSYTFSGLRGTVDGDPAVLLMDGNGSPDPEQAIYTFTDPTTRKPLSRPPARNPNARVTRRRNLPHSVIAQALLDAMIDATRHPVLPTSTTGRTHPEVVELDRRRATLAKQLLDAQTLTRLRTGQVDETVPETGEPVMSAARRKRTWDEIDALEAETEDLIRQLGELDLQITLAEARHDLLAKGAEVDTIIDMVASLRDPRDRTHRDSWLRAIRDLVVTHERIRIAGSGGTRLSVSFNLRLTDADTTVDVPAHWAHVYGPAGRQHAAATAVLGELRRGVTLKRAGTRVSHIACLVALIRDELGMAGPAPQLNCPHPDLLRLHLAVIDAHPTPGNPTPPEVSAQIVSTVATHDAAARFGGSAAARTLLARILQVDHTGKRVRPQYYRGCPDSEQAALRAAADGRVVDDDTMPFAKRQAARNTLKNNGAIALWDVGPQNRLTLNPCVHCAAKVLVCSQLFEVTGYVCLACRRDTAGVVWDATFDPWLHPADLVEQAARTRKAENQPPAAAPTLATALPGPTGSRDTTYSTHDPLDSAGMQRDHQADGTVPEPAITLDGTPFPRTKTKYRQLADVDAHERKAIVRAYDKEGLGLRELVERHDVASRVVRQIVADAGALRTRGRRRG